MPRLPPFLILSGFLLVPALHAEPRWFKGNTHTHTLWSDGNDFPEMVVDWYKSRGYHFLALSDHNVLHDAEVWMDVKAVEKRRKALGRGTLEKYQAKFGADWVLTRQRGETTEVRLRRLSEYAPRFEEPERFLLVTAEEISASFGAAPLHLNGLNLRERIVPVKDYGSIPETLQANLRLVTEQSRRLGIPMLTHVNHPNFRWAMTAEDLASITEDRFFEIYNGHPMIHWQGDEHHEGHERLWDIANTLRLTRHHAPPLYGVGTDDSHHYHGEESSPGRGWIMVRAEQLTAPALIEAMRRGDFYASSGVTLEDVEFADGVFRMRIQAEPGVRYQTRILGTRQGFDAATTEAKMPAGDPHPSRHKHSPSIGETLDTLDGPDIAWKPRGDELYFRASVLSSKPHPNPAYPGEFGMAWTQPVVPR